MPALQVRDMPEELYGCLKNQAKTNHRSLAQETIYVLEKSLTPGQEKTLQDKGLRENDLQKKRPARKRSNVPTRKPAPLYSKCRRCARTH